MMHGQKKTSNLVFVFVK